MSVTFGWSGPVCYCPPKKPSVAPVAMFRLEDHLVGKAYDFTQDNFALLIRGIEVLMSRLQKAERQYKENTDVCWKLIARVAELESACQRASVDNPCVTLNTRLAILDKALDGGKTQGV